MSNGEVLRLTSELAAEWGIGRQKTVEVRAGSRKATARLLLDNGIKRGNWRVNEALSRRLLLNHSRLLIRYDRRQDAVCVGPNVGILSTFLPASGSYEPTSVRAELIYLSRLSRQLPGQFYVFTPAAVNWEQNHVRAAVFQPGAEGGGHWKTALYPLPEVVYDRITSRVGENKSSVREVKERLWALEGMKYFNPSYLNKWQVWEYLSRNAALEPFLPETMMLDRSNLELMLKRYPRLYLKPVHGSLGLGIISVERRTGGGLNYTVYRRGVHAGRAASVTDFLNQTRGSRRQMSYIVQQGIDLAKVRGSIFDLRIILQKDRAGQWQITKKVARIAPAGSGVSNLRRGGQAIGGERLLKMIFGSDSAALKEKNRQLLSLCLEIADTIERISGKIYGELGLDIGLDVRQRWWLIEVNSKPRKTTETEASQRVMRQSFLRPLEYATWLAGF